MGHPAGFLRTLEQRQKSWYMLLFQYAGIAERWLSEDNWANFRAWAGHPDADQVIAELEANGSLTPGLNYYRANIPPECWVAPPLQLPPVQAPTMGIWSTGDVALTEVQMTDSAKNVAGSWRYERLDGPGHWMQLEAPDQVTPCCWTSCRADWHGPVGAGMRPVRSRSSSALIGQCSQSGGQCPAHRAAPSCRIAGQAGAGALRAMALGSPGPVSLPRSARLS